MIKRILIFALIAGLANTLSAQTYLSKERETEIKTSERYYWGECSDFEESKARQCAFNDLKERVIGDAVKQSIQQDEALKAIDMGAHLDRLEQKGRTKILAWIAKDSVFVTTQKPITQKPVAKPQPAPAQPSPAPQQSQVSQHTPPTANPVLQELAACKNYREVRRVATVKGLVRGGTMNSSEGFANPAQCIIAVFTDDGALAALLDKGSSTRVDLLSGKTVQNPEQQYKQYSLWYLQQK